MAESKNADHVFVEIPAPSSHLRRRRQSLASGVPLIEDHPLMEISRSPGHLLLLKLWQREEDLFNCRIARKETRLDGIKREVFQLCCFFFAFYGFHLTLLFASSIHSPPGVCRKWWAPSCFSLFSSLVVVLSVQLKLFRYMKVQGQSQKEKSDNRALVRCIQELRMKGASFDLSKQPQVAKRMKSSSVEIKWRPLKWCSESLVTIFLLCVTGLAFPASNFIICG